MQLHSSSFEFQRRSRQGSYFVHDYYGKTQFGKSEEYVLETAIQKGRDVHKRMDADFDIIISADTVVVFNSAILEKPKSSQEAVDMLTRLSGNTHSVLTAICIIYRDCYGGIQEKSFVESTSVKFMRMTHAMIEEYVATGEPM